MDPEQNPDCQNRPCRGSRSSRTRAQAWGRLTATRRITRSWIARRRPVARSDTRDARPRESLLPASSCLPWRPALGSRSSLPIPPAPGANLSTLGHPHGKDGAEGENDERHRNVTVPTLDCASSNAKRAHQRTPAPTLNLPGALAKPPIRGRSGGPLPAPGHGIAVAV